MSKMTKTATKLEIEQTLASCIAKALKSTGGDYRVAKCKEGIQISHADYYDSNVPFENVILSDNDCKDIFDSFDKGIFEAYIKLFPNAKPVTDNSNETPHRNGTGDQERDDNNANNEHELSKSSTIQSDKTAGQLCAAGIDSDGFAVVFMILELNLEEIKNDALKSLSAYVALRNDAERLSDIIRNNESLEQPTPPPGSYFYDKNPFRFETVYGGSIFAKYNGEDEIGDYELENNNILKSVTIPVGITRIGVRAFFSCENLERIVIPKSVTKIGSNAFTNCNKLTTADIYAEKDSILIYPDAFPEHTTIKFINEG